MQLLGAIVFASVQVSVASLGELLTAEVTLEWFGIGVGSSMSHSGRQCRKDSFAHQAGDLQVEAPCLTVQYETL